MVSKKIYGVIILLLVTIMGVAPPLARARPDRPMPPGRWWRLPKVADELQLTEDETQALDDAFHRSEGRHPEAATGAGHNSGKRTVRRGRRTKAVREDRCRPVGHGLQAFRGSIASQENSWPESLRTTQATISPFQEKPYEWTWTVPPRAARE